VGIGECNLEKTGHPEKEMEVKSPLFSSFTIEQRLQE